MMTRILSRLLLTFALLLACESVFAQTNAAVCAEIAWPNALAPAYREFEARCKAGTATRGELIALKKFIAASAVDGASKTNLTRQARKVYQETKKKRKRGVAL